MLLSSADYRENGVEIEQPFDFSALRTPPGSMEEVVCGIAVGDRRVSLTQEAYERVQDGFRRVAFLAERAGCAVQQKGYSFRILPPIDGDRLIPENVMERVGSLAEAFRCSLKSITDQPKIIDPCNIERN